MRNRLFLHPNSGLYLIIGSSALNHMYKYIQRGAYDTEAGGEIFCSDPDANGLMACTATGPNPKDIRARTHFNPDRKATFRHRLEQFDRGRHAIGLWHTHPEDNPTPSPLDRASAEKFLLSFHGDRERYFMITVGNHGAHPKISVVSAGTGNWIEWYEVSRL